MRHLVWLVLSALPISLASAHGEAPGDILAKAPSHFAKSSTGKVHYKSLGEGDTAVVFVHGWCCDHSVWGAQAADLDGKVRMLFVDLPGYGKSDSPRIDYTMDAFARGIDAVLADAGVEQAVLVGHSMGTPVVVEFYRLFSAKTKALVFVDGALRPFTKDPAVAEQFLSRFKEETFKETAPKSLASMMSPNTPVSVRKHIKRLVTNTSPQAAISSMRCMVDPKLWKEDPIKVPAQALMAKSRFWNDEYKEFAKKLVPDLDYREFEGVSHFLFMEKPREFDAALSEFLTKQGLIK